MSTADLAGDTAAAIEFLRCWEPDGPWVLTAIEPDGKTETVTFHPGEEAKLSHWIGSRQGKRNIYFQTNRVKHAVSKKTSKADIGWMLAAHVDADPSGTADLDTEQQRIFENLRTHEPPPSVIISSGGGMQGFWLLEEPAAVDDIDLLEACNVALEKALGADSCHNIDRIMRLPGTINLPNRRKRLAGREPALASVAEANWDRRYRLEDLKRTIASDMPDPRSVRANGHDTQTESPTREVDIDALPLSKRIRDLIRGVHDPEHPYRSRSEAVMAVLVAMAANGCSDDQMRAAVLDQGFPDGAHIREHKKPDRYLMRQIAKARRLFASPEVVELNQTYALILVGDQAAILREGVSPEGRPNFSLMTLSAFNYWLGNRFVQAGAARISLPKYWLRHPDRREYEGLLFEPDRDVPGHYNLWRGFSVQPRPGNCQRFLDHLLYNVCQGDLGVYLWVVGWFADLFQNRRGSAVHRW